MSTKRSIPMKTSILVGFVGALSCSAVPCAAAQEELFKDTNAYANCQDRFAVIFPSRPSMRDVAFVTQSGASVAARQHYLEQGPDRFSVTVVALANGPALDEQIINHAADIRSEEHTSELQSLRHLVCRL